MDEKFTKREVSELTGEDIENIADAQHPERNPLDKKESGMPNLDAAAWDNELNDKDKGDIHLQDVNFRELAPEDRELYLEMDALRKEFEEGSGGDGLKKRVEDFVKRFKETNMGIANKSRKSFLAMVANKIFSISLEIQHRQRRDEE